MTAKQKSKQTASPPPLVANDSLVEELFAQLDNPNTTVQDEASAVLRQMSESESLPITTSSTAPSTLKKSSRARFQERQARKQAEKEASQPLVDTAADARIQQETKDEESAIRHQCQKLGVTMFEIPPDGHCLFSAIGDQLNLLNMIPRDIPPYVVTRRAAADYIQSHPQEFIPFLPSPEGEDGRGATDGGGLMSADQFQHYCYNIRETGIWGGEPEIQALSKAFNIPIHVIQWSDPSIVVHSPQTDQSNTGPVAMISYHRRMYGLGEHYNSLRPNKSSFTSSLVKDIFS